MKTDQVNQKIGKHTVVKDLAPRDDQKVKGGGETYYLMTMETTFITKISG